MLIDFGWSSTIPKRKNKGLGTVSYILSSAVPNAIEIVLLSALEVCLLEIKSKRECSDLEAIEEHFNKYKDRILTMDKELIIKVIELVYWSTKHNGFMTVISDWFIRIRSRDNVVKKNEEAESAISEILDRISARGNELNTMESDADLLDIRTGKITQGNHWTTLPTKVFLLKGIKPRMRLKIKYLVFYAMRITRC
eukprot:NODE_83_length_22684_cov_0.307934.p8 type:complete len:196 gc:universal NODE_83_length_22684_cov_0.307934:20663-20076(-)